MNGIYLGRNIMPTDPESEKPELSKDTKLTVAQGIVNTQKALAG